jgi:MFS transporter, DHA2 family, methylenomycin A resistance protein
VLVAAGVANVLIFLDQTAVVVALHAIQRQFHCSTVEVQWTIGMYLLVLAALAAGSGRIADLYGRRRLFLGGISVFGLGSAACAVAPSVTVLIAARAVQGAGAALTAPLIVAHATAVVPDNRRAWAIGVVASAGTSFLVLGPLLGGLLVDTVGWRWIFLINIPVVVIAVALGARFMTESRAPNPPPLDVPGLVLLTAAFAAIVIALLHIHSLNAGLAVGLLVAGGCALSAFVAVERRSPHPLVALELLGKPRVIVSIAALIAIQGSVLGVTVYVVLYLQNGLGLKAIVAGCVLIAAGMWTPLLSRMTGRIVDRQGSRLPISRGLLTAAAGLVTIGLTARAHSALALIPGLLLFGVSRPFVFTPASAGPMRNIPASARGLAASLVAESRQTGAVLGVAVLGSIIAGYEVHGQTGASAAGLEAAMFAAAAACLVAAILVIVLVPARRG